MEWSGHPQDKNKSMEKAWSGTPELHGVGQALVRYEFPKDLRRLGGDFTVDDNVKRLLRFLRMTVPH